MESITIKHLLNEHRADIEKQLGYLVNVAKKLKLTPPTWSFGEVYDFEFEILLGTDYQGEEPEEEYEIYIEPCFDVTINVFETLKLEGNWIFACAIDHRAKAMIQIDETAVIPMKYTPSNDYCEHCGKHYPRVKSFIVHNQLTGEYKQVGKGCLKQFLGINPASYITMFEAISKFSPIIKGYGYKNTGGRLDNLAYDVKEMFQFTAHQVAKDGKFVKPEWEERQIGETWNRFPVMKNFRTNEGEATLDKVNQRLTSIGYFRCNPNDFNDSTTIEELQIRLAIANRRLSIFPDTNLSERAYKKVGEIKYLISSINRRIIAIQHKSLVTETILPYDEELDAIKSFFEQLTVQTNEQVVSSDKDFKFEITQFGQYQQLLKTIFSKERTLQSNLKTIVSGYNYWINTLERERLENERREKAKDLKYIGTVGEKKELILKVIFLKTGEGQYGTWKLWNLEDSEGNKFSKFGEINRKYTIDEAKPDEDSSDVQIGSTISIIAEIKEHSEFKQERITSLGRLSKVKSAKYILQVDK